VTRLGSRYFYFGIAHRSRPIIHQRLGPSSTVAGARGGGPIGGAARDGGGAYGAGLRAVVVSGTASAAIAGACVARARGEAAGAVVGAPARRGRGRAPRRPAAPAAGGG